jgi:hypothetical protein
MDEDLEMEDPNAEMLASKYGMGFAADSPLAPFMANLEGMRAGIAAEREAVAKRKKELFEAGEKKIMADRYGAPTTREQLFALSAALASPRYYGGIAGTMSRVAPVLSEMSSLQSKAESQRSAALDQLRQQYEEGTLTSRLEGLESEAAAYSQMMPSLVSASKPRMPRSVGTQVVGGKVVAVMQDPDTGAPYSVPIGDAPEKAEPPIQISGVTFKGQPVFRVGERIQLADGTPVTQFDPKEGKAEKPRAPSSTEMRQIIQTEDIVNNRLAGIRSVQDALGLNQQAYEGSLAGGRAALARLFSSDDPAYVATEQLEQLVKSGALADLKATFGGNPTEGERKALLELQANITKPRAVREKFLRRLLQEMQIGLGNQTKRLEDLKTGQYGQYQQPAPATAKGKPRVINWGN